MKKPLISVVIGAYNCGAFIQETVNSVINQSMPDWELIIVDDCSTDDTCKKINTIKDKRIKLITLEKNSHLPAITRNIGIRESSGKYIAFLDHDDLWLRDKLKIQSEYIGKNPDIALTFCSFRIKSPSRRWNNKILSPKRRINPGYLYDQLLGFNFIPCSSVVAKKSVLEEMHYFDEDPDIVTSEDWDLWLRIAMSHKIAFIPKVLGIYKMHSANFSGTGKRLEKAIYAVDKHLKNGWIKAKQASRAKANFYFREGWFFVDKDQKRAKALLYNALNLECGNKKARTVCKLGLFLSAHPHFSKFIKNNALDMKINSIIKFQNL